MIRKPLVFWWFPGEQKLINSLNIRNEMCGRALSIQNKNKYLGPYGTCTIGFFFVKIVNGFFKGTKYAYVTLG